MIFQSDNIICSTSGFTIDDFLDYDFIGAPIDDDDDDAALGSGVDYYSGALSIWNRDMIPNILNRWGWRDEMHAVTAALGDGHEHDHIMPANHNIDSEDQRFLKKIRELPNNNELRIPAPYLPPKEVASMFSVQSIWRERPLGFSAR